MPDFSQGSFHDPYKISAMELWRLTFRNNRLYVTKQFSKTTVRRFMIRTMQFCASLSLSFLSM